MNKILVIDDQKDNLTTMEAVIKSHLQDCKVLTALSGSEGIKMAVIEQPDTILLDIFMPGMDGFEVCKRLKADQSTHHIPIVMVTAIKTDVESRVKGLNLGADAFLSKPIDPVELSAQVTVMLRIKAAEDKLRAEKDQLDRVVKERTSELLESELLNRSITQSAADAIVTVNVDGIILSWNLAAEKIFGHKSSEIINKSLSTVIPEEYKAIHKNGISRLKNGETPRLIGKTVETKALRLDGTEFPIELSLSAWETNNQKYYTGIIRDITERKRVEQIQKTLFNISNASIASGNLNKLISLIRKELGTVIDTTNFYIATYDPLNDNFILPYIADEKNDFPTFPAGKTLTKYVINTNESLLATRETIDKLAASGEIEIIGEPAEVWLGVPLFAEGKATGVIAVQSYSDKNAFDESDKELLEFIADQISISIERKKAEGQLNEALTKATKSDHIKSVFLATMSHELRTPLNAIIGFSELIEESMPLDEIIEFNKTIHSSGLHLLSIVEDIFDISLIESGEIKINKENASLLAILYDVHNIITIEQHKLKKTHIDLNLIMPDDKTDWIINTDASKLKQIIINLLKNALKFTNKGHVHYGYHFETVLGMSSLKFYVEDTGIGISEHMKDLIFEPFRQVDDTNTRSHGGTGIGLSISKKLTELMGGRIWLDSEKEDLLNEKTGGSTFYFYIPVERHPKENSGFLDKTLPENVLKGKKILVVEDIEESYYLLKMVLEKFEINAEWAISGSIAIKYIKENPNTDLILMDINMPEMDGYETTRAIRKFNKDIKIIAQTAYALSGDRDKAIEAGCDDYISKPINKNDLQTILKKVISTASNNR